MKPASVKVNENTELSTLKQLNRSLPHSPSCCMKHRMVHSRHRNKCANLRGFLGCLTAQTHLISWMREILRGDMAGLVSDFRLSESRRIPRFKGKQFLVSRNPSKDSTINIRR